MGLSSVEAIQGGIEKKNRQSDRELVANSAARGAALADARLDSVRR